METTNTRAAPAPQPNAHTERPYLLVIGGARVGRLHELSRARTIVGRGPDAHVRLDDDGISREHAEVTVSDGRVSVRDLGSTNGTFRNGVRADAGELHDGDKLSVGAATLLVFTHDGDLERTYARAAVRDTATAALKREIFLERLVEEVSFSRRHGAPFSVLAWELDGFGALSDELGPSTTERCLAAVARAARAVLGDDELLAVLGPGRFGVACRETDTGAASERAARLGAAVARTRWEGGATRPPLSASVGVAVATAGTGKTSEAARGLLARAEAALAVARARGGACVEIDAASREV